MNVFSIIGHLNLILAFVNSVKDYIGKAVAAKAVPTASEAKPVFDALRALLDAGVIAIPGVSDQELSAGVKAIEDQICPVSAPTA